MEEKECWKREVVLKEKECWKRRSVMNRMRVMKRRRVRKRRRMKKSSRKSIKDTGTEGRADGRRTFESVEERKRKGRRVQTRVGQ